MWIKKIIEIGATESCCDKNQGHEPAFPADGYESPTVFFWFEPVFLHFGIIKLTAKILVLFRSEVFFGEFKIGFESVFELGSFGGTALQQSVNSFFQTYCFACELVDFFYAIFDAHWGGKTANAGKFFLVELMPLEIVLGLIGDFFRIDAC